jgi:hypothetical protein
MTKYKTIEEFLNDLNGDKRAQVDAIRELILDLGFELEESIKWNAPNYNYKDVDRITFNTMNKEGKIKLVLHFGTDRKENKKGEPVIKNTPDFVFWNSDIRATLTFDSEDDVKEKKADLKELLTKWLQLD